MSAKQRLDVLLVQKGLFPSREKAKSSIMAGLVRVDGKIVDKAGTEVPEKAVIEVSGPAIPYVSRGGLKLEKALAEFGISLDGKTVVDIGASTGGFTDCALKHGAARVYAVDVGYGQLDWTLRRDPRVVNMERTNVRHMDASLIVSPPDLVTVDVSFVSLAKVLPKVAEILPAGGQAVALIKPQFEAGRDKVGKKGVVRNPQVHVEVIEKVVHCAEALGLTVTGLTFSPVRGPEGNIEYLICLRRGTPAGEPGSTVAKHIEETVQQAWQTLV